MLQKSETRECYDNVSDENSFTLSPSTTLGNSMWTNCRWINTTRTKILTLPLSLRCRSETYSGLFTLWLFWYRTFDFDRFAEEKFPGKNVYVWYLLTILFEWSFACFFRKTTNQWSTLAIPLIWDECRTLIHSPTLATRSSKRRL